MPPANSKSKRLPALLLGYNMRSMRRAVKILYNEDIPPSLDATGKDIDAAVCAILGAGGERAHEDFSELLHSFLAIYHVEEIATHWDIFGRLREALEDRLEKIERANRELIQSDPLLRGWWTVGHAFSGLISDLYDGTATFPKGKEDPCLIPGEMMAPLREAVKGLPVGDRHLVNEALPKLQPWDESDLIQELYASFDRVRLSLGGEGGPAGGVHRPFEGGTSSGSPTTLEAAEGGRMVGLVSSSDPIDEDRINPQGNWSVVVTSHGTYYLNEAARVCFARMYDAHKKGYHLDAKAIVRGLDIDDRRIDHIFSRSGAWAKNNTKLVGRSTQGRSGVYQINL